MNVFFSKYAAIIFTVLLLSYAAFVFSRLLTVPDFFLDEGFKMQLARNFMEFGKIGIQLSPGEIVASLHNASTGWILPVTLGTAFKFFGVSFFTGRAVAALYLLGFLIISWFFVRRTWGEAAGLLSALLLMTFLPLFANGKMILAEVPSLFFLSAGLLALFHWKPGTLTNAALAGLFFGLFASGKLAYLAIFGVAVLCALGYALYKKALPWAYTGIFLLVFLLAALPTLVLALLPLFAAAPGIALSPDAYTNVYGAGCLTCLVGDNLLLWLTDTTLFHLSVLLLAGLLALVAFLRKKEIGNGGWMVLTIAFFTLGTIAYFLVSPAVYRYLLPAQVVLLALFPAALLSISASFPRLLSRRFAYGIVIALILVQGVHFARGSSLTSGDKAFLFERYARENINETHSIGVINSSLAPAFVPNGHMNQFFHFLSGTIVEGRNPLAVPNDELPDFIIYEKYDTYALDVAPYKQTLDSLYEQNVEIEGLFVFRKKPD